MTPSPTNATFAISFLRDPRPWSWPGGRAGVNRLTAILAGLCRAALPGLKDDVLKALGKVSGPDGSPLPATGKLSEIVATDGKVFFSITVEAAAVKAWETVRERAEAAVRALPGVKSVMVALTAERAGGGGGSARPGP